MSTTPYKGRFTERQQAELLDLLWNSLRQDRDFKDRKHTGWGTKTTTGLLACIESIVYNQGEFQVRTETDDEETCDSYGTFEDASVAYHTLLCTLQDQANEEEQHIELLEVLRQDSVKQFSNEEEA